MRVLCFTGNRKSIRWMAAGVALTGGLLLGRSLFAQEAPNAPMAQPATTAQTSRGETFGGLNYLNGYSFLKGPIAPYKTREVPTPNLSNSPRMDQLVRDGKIYLSMSDAVALALENNLDLAIARYNLPIADTDILRTRAGGFFRGARGSAEGRGLLARADRQAAEPAARAGAALHDRSRHRHERQAGPAA